MVWRAWGQPMAWLFGAMAGFGVLVLAVLLYAAKSGNPEPYTFGDISDSSSDILGHIGSYIAAAVIDPSASASGAGLAAVVFSLIFLVHVSVGLVHVNPLFYVLGYRVYSGTSVSNFTYYLVARTDVADWKGPQELVPIHDSILIERRKR